MKFTNKLFIGKKGILTYQIVLIAVAIGLLILISWWIMAGHDTFTEFIKKIFG